MSWLMPTMLMVVMGFFFSLADYAFADPLRDARKALEEGKRSEAMRLYKKIPFSDRSWSEKITDLARLYILEKQYEESWRITQIAHRTRTRVEDLDYLEELSMILFGNCLLKDLLIEQEEDPRAYLLRAYVYRYHRRYQSSSYDFDHEADGQKPNVVAHSTASGTHYLEDIPKAHLIKYRGCRFFRGRFDDVKVANRYELAMLAKWYEDTDGSIDSQGAPKVWLRILDLTDDQDKGESDETKELKKTIRARFLAKDQLSLWLTLSTSDQLFLWRILMEAEERSPKGKVTAAEKQFILSLILASHDREVVQWLGLVPLYEWSETEQEKIARHLFAIETIPNHAYITAVMAEQRYARGKWRESLNYIRRLLVLGEAQGSEEIRAFAVDLSGRILEEYRFDQAVLGAMQTSLPSDLWIDVYRRLAISSALSGSKSGYDMVFRAANDRSRNYQKLFRPDEEEILSSIVHRQARKLSDAVKKWEDKVGNESRKLSLLVDIAKRAASYTDAERLAMKPYFDSFAKYLRSILQRGKAKPEHEELMHFFSSGSRDEWLKAVQSVREGGQVMGVADLRSQKGISSPYVWNPPAHLPLADLLYFPDQAFNRKWIIR